MTQTEQIAAEINRIRRLTANRMGVPAEQHAATTAAAQEVEAQIRPAFRAMLADLKLPQLKALAKQVRANTRGAQVRRDWERAIEKVWRAEVWDEAGYRYGVRPARQFPLAMVRRPA